MLIQPFLCTAHLKSHTHEASINLLPICKLLFNKGFAGALKIARGSSTSLAALTSPFLCTAHLNTHSHEIWTNVLLTFGNCRCVRESPKEGRKDASQSRLPTAPASLLDPRPPPLLPPPLPPHVALPRNSLLEPLSTTIFRAIRTPSAAITVGAGRGLHVRGRR